MFQVQGFLNILYITSFIPVNQREGLFCHSAHFTNMKSEVKKITYPGSQSYGVAILTCRLKREPPATLLPDSRDCAQTCFPWCRRTDDFTRQRMANIVIGKPG